MSEHEQNTTSQAEEEFWGDNEDVIKKGKKSIIRYLSIKVITMIFVAYIISGYMTDLNYFFSTDKITPLPKATIDTIEEYQKNIPEYLKKLHNKEVSISGWVELEKSFAVKIGFSKYNVLKLWQIPVFVAVKQGERGVDKDDIAAAIPFLDVNGRLLNYDRVISDNILFNPYTSIAKGYLKIAKERLGKGAILIMAHEAPKKDYKVLIILLVLLGYILYSLYSIYKIVKGTSEQS
ncbi:hypothetical protein JXR93_08155 [bacterium]|nr:hypothetical protein [bacterium]